MPHKTKNIYCTVTEFSWLLFLSWRRFQQKRKWHHVNARRRICFQRGVWIPNCQNICTVTLFEWTSNGLAIKSVPLTYIEASVLILYSVHFSPKHSSWMLFCTVVIKVFPPLLCNLKILFWRQSRSALAQRRTSCVEVFLSIPLYLSFFIFPAASENVSLTFRRQSRARIIRFQQI